MLVRQVEVGAMAVFAYLLGDEKQGKGSLLTRRQRRIGSSKRRKRWASPSR